MINAISAENAQDALVGGLLMLRDEGVNRDSRNGPVIQLDGPTVITYERPQERVVLWPMRDANPFFHFFESLWMLSGREDVAFVARFAKRMETFSDDGKTLNGAYGHRWRRHFKKDQLLIIAERLRKNRDDRRCVLGMWDSRTDLGADSKDVPCNTHAFVQVNVDGELDLTVCNRSNDVVWGAFGANVVHFTVLHEVLSAVAGYPMGRFVQFTQNLHGYHSTALPLINELSLQQRSGNWPLPDPYDTGVGTYPIVNRLAEDWLTDLDLFMAEPETLKTRDPFFSMVARPLYAAHKAFKSIKGPARYKAASDLANVCEAGDWRRACLEWLNRREDSEQRAQDDGVRAAETVA